MKHNYFISKAKKNAFTLIEVVIALAIFAIASVVLSQGFMEGIISLERFDFIQDLGETQGMIKRHILSIEDKEILLKGGNFKLLSMGTVEWRVQLEKTDLKDLYRMQIELEIKEKKQLIKEQVFVFKPEWGSVIDNKSERAAIT